MTLDPVRDAGPFDRELDWFMRVEGWRSRRHEVEQGLWDSGLTYDSWSTDTTAGELSIHAIGDGRFEWIDPTGGVVLRDRDAVRSAVENGYPQRPLDESDATIEGLLAAAHLILEGVEQMSQHRAVLYDYPIALPPALVMLLTHQHSLKDDITGLPKAIEIIEASAAVAPANVRGQRWTEPLTPGQITLYHRLAGASDRNYRDTLKANRADPEF